MMRSRVTGCLCLDCSGGWYRDRTAQKREWRDWEREYVTNSDVDYFYDEVPYWAGKELGWVAQT